MPGLNNRLSYMSRLLVKGDTRAGEKEGAHAGPVLFHDWSVIPTTEVQVRRDAADDKDLRRRFRPSFWTSDRRAAMRSETSRTAGLVEVLSSINALRDASSCDWIVVALALLIKAEYSTSGIASWPCLSINGDLDTTAGTTVSRIALKTAHSVSLQKSTGGSAGRAGLSGATMSPVKTILNEVQAGAALVPDGPAGFEMGPASCQYMCGTTGSRMSVEGVLLTKSNHVVHGQSQGQDLRARRAEARRRVE